MPQDSWQTNSWENFMSNWLRPYTEIGSRFLQIVHNPGVIPDSRLTDPSTDVTVVFEQAYRQYKTMKTNLESLPQNRTKYSYIVHSLPQNMDKKDLRNYVNDLSKHAKYLFVTSLSQGYYQSFGDSWKTFIDVFPS